RLLGTDIGRVPVPPLDDCAMGLELAERPGPRAASARGLDRLQSTLITSRVPVFARCYVRTYHPRAVGTPRHGRSDGRSSTTRTATSFITVETMTGFTARRSRRRVGSLALLP